RDGGRAGHLPAQPPRGSLTANGQSAIPANMLPLAALRGCGLGRFACDLAPATQRLAGPVLARQLLFVLTVIRVRFTPRGARTIRGLLVVTGRGTTGLAVGEQRVDRLTDRVGQVVADGLGDRLTHAL